MKAFFSFCNIILFLLGSLAPGNAKDKEVVMVPQTIQHTESVSGAFQHLETIFEVRQLTSQADGEVVWANVALLEGEVKDVTLMAEGEILFLAGIAGEDARLQGDLMASGPFMILIDRATGDILAQKYLGGAVDNLSATIHNGTATLKLTTPNKVMHYFVALDLLVPSTDLFNPLLDAVVEDNGNSADPAGDDGGTSSTSNGNNNNTGSGDDPPANTGGN